MVYNNQTTKLNKTDMRTLQDITQPVGSPNMWRAANNDNTQSVLQCKSILLVCRRLPMDVDSEKEKRIVSGVPFFFGVQRSKVIARVTQKSLSVLDSFRAYLALRGCGRATDTFSGGWMYPKLRYLLPIVAYIEATYPPDCFIPDGHKTAVRMKQVETSSPAGRFCFRLPGYRYVPGIFHNTNIKCYGNDGK